MGYHCTIPESDNLLIILCHFGVRAGAKIMRDLTGHGESDTAYIHGDWGASVGETMPRRSSNSARSD